jgi:hypothetical protein
LHVKVVSGLEVHPKSIRCAECSCQPKGGVRADTSFTVNDLVDAARGHSDRLGKTVLADAKRSEEVFQKNLAGVNGLVCGSHNISSVIVGDFDIYWPSGCPREADAPLVVDSDAVLAFSVALQLFETVARWNAQVIDGFSGVEYQ